MYIGVKELGRYDLRFREDFLPGTIDYRSSEFRQTGPLRVEVAVGLEGEEIHLAGRLAGSFELRCARCLEPVRRRIERKFDLVYRPVKRNRAGVEHHLTDTELEAGYYRGDGLFLADAVAEQINLEMPLKALCSEECQGVCPSCGVNLNQGRCRCNPHEADPRWAALAEWKHGSSGR